MYTNQIILGMVILEIIIMLQNVVTGIFRDFRCSLADQPFAQLKLFKRLIVNVVSIVFLYKQQTPLFLENDCHTN